MIRPMKSGGAYHSGPVGSKGLTAARHAVFNGPQPDSNGQHSRYAVRVELLNPVAADEALLAGEEEFGGVVGEGVWVE